MNLKYLATVLLINILFLINAQQCDKAGVFLAGMNSCQEGGYSLVFEDNFDGNSLDLTKWKLPYQGILNDFDFNNAKCWLANTGDSPNIPIENNIEVSNGTLKIIGKRENPPIQGTVTNWSVDPPLTQVNLYEYSSAWIETYDKFYFGKYEIRCRLPNGKGFWPAFWTYGGQRWNEIDVFEIYGKNITRFTCNIHHDFDGDGHSESCQFGQNDVADFTDWHVFTCTFEFDRIVWEIDGNPIRILPRYTTAAGNALYCGDNIGNGVYFQEQAFPLEEMHIFLNMAIESGLNSPDETTPFPGVFEIDYVRYYVFEEIDICMTECLDYLSYENTTDLPELSRAKNFIRAGNEVVVKSDQTVVFKAPKIELLNGFSTQPNCKFEAYSDECNYYNYENVPLVFLSDLVNSSVIKKCIDPIFKIEATGVLYYSFIVSNALGQIIHQDSGQPSSNFIEVWNAESASQGWYKVEQVLTNCTENDNRIYNVFVSNDGCNKSKEILDEFDAVNEINDDFSIYPNPSNNLLNIMHFEEKEGLIIYSIFDISGKELLKENGSSFEGINLKVLNLNSLSSGLYILSVLSSSNKYESQFIISK